MQLTFGIGLGINLRLRHRRNSWILLMVSRTVRDAQKFIGNETAVFNDFICAFYFISITLLSTKKMDGIKN